MKTFEGVVKLLSPDHFLITFYCEKDDKFFAQIAVKDKDIISPNNRVIIHESHVNLTDAVIKAFIPFLIQRYDIV